MESPACWPFTLPVGGGGGGQGGLCTPNPSPTPTPTPPRWPGEALILPAPAAHPQSLRSGSRVTQLPQGADATSLSAQCTQRPNRGHLLPVPRAARGHRTASHRRGEGVLRVPAACGGLGLLQPPGGLSVRESAGWASASDRGLRTGRGPLSWRSFVGRSRPLSRLLPVQETKPELPAAGAQPGSTRATPGLESGGSAGLWEP